MTTDVLAVVKVKVAQDTEVGDLLYVSDGLAYSIEGFYHPKEDAWEVPEGTLIALESGKPDNTVRAVVFDK